MYDDEQKSFLQKLQESDEGTKTRWMVGSTIVAGAFVIYIWIGYFGGLISVSPAVVASENQSGAQSAPHASISENLKKGSAALYGIFMDNMANLGQILDAPRQYIIK